MIALVLCLLLAGSTSARQVLQVETDGATANVITGFDEGAVLVQSGCVMPDSAYIWYRCPVAYPEGVLSLAADAELSSAVDTPELSAVTNETDYTNTVMVESLQPATKYYYQVTCSSEEGEVTSVVASFKTAPAPDTPASVSFVWLADMAGQGWGQSKNASFIDFEGEEIQGGYLFASTALKMQPDFAVLQGDMIYADNVISPTKEMPEDLGGGLWYNDNTKDFSAITLDDFRMNWKYNLGDARWRAFLEQTPVFVQWDDHEVVNNWYPTEVHAQEPYLGLTSEDLFAPAWQSLFEYNPIMGDRLYKKVSYGSHLDIFIVDYRTYRDVNPKNNQSELVQMMGEEQFEWFTSELSQSNATWKLISNHDPFSIVTGGENDWDAWSAGNDEIQGRELQLQAILELIQQENICNVHAFSADVHYASAIFYDPEQAAGGFTDFKPFYEFVIGPIHAGAFGPNAILDASFGPTYEFVYGPGTEGFVNVNLPPPVVASMGHMQIDGATGALTVTIMQTNGEPLYTRTFEPEVCA